MMAWAVAVGGPAGVRRIGELHGWLRRSPPLAVGLLGPVVALVGWPGSALWQARADLFGGALGQSFAIAGLAVAVATAAVAVRLVAVGLARPDPNRQRENVSWRRRERLASGSAGLLAVLAVAVAALGPG
jgi:hypothetical protein